MADQTPRRGEAVSVAEDVAAEHLGDEVGRTSGTVTMAGHDKGSEVLAWPAGVAEGP